MSRMTTHGNVTFWEESFADHFMYDTVIAENLKYVDRGDWFTDGQPNFNFEELGLTLRLQEAGNSWAIFVLDGENAIVKIGISPRNVTAWVAATTRERSRELMKRLREQAPEMEVKQDDGTVPVTFWTYTPRGPAAQERRIDAHTWDSIEDNYTAKVAKDLSRLYDDEFRPAFGGQLILWHGPPGTGKTHALRALAWEWRDWADLHYIVDPDNLFGSYPDYLLQVLLAEGDANPLQMLADEHEEQPEEAKPRWKVLILEDSGEMLSADAKDRVGQALSRLLNTVDGFIGQGLRVLVVLTTNEEIKKLHPAVARPGRCAANTLFDEFSKDEAKEWVEARDGDPDRITGKRSLAELFAEVEGYAEKGEPSLAGFTT